MHAMQLTALHANLRQELLARYRQFSTGLDLARKLWSEDAPQQLVARALRDARVQLQRCQDSYGDALMILGRPGGPHADRARSRMLPFLQAYAEQLACANADVVHLESSDVPA